jgi:PHD/YefM family antitoxin component YafN of YafNO toxin-antitoxin module
MYNVTSDYAKEHFEEILQRAKTEPDGVLIVQEDKNFILINQEELEDSLDLQEALEVLAEAKANREIPMSWEEFEAELDNQ